MRYKTKIAQQGNKYVGYLLQDGQPIYTTNELSDPVLVSRELATQAAHLMTPSAITPKIALSHIPPESEKQPIREVRQQSFSGGNIPSRQPSSRKCCGRG